MARMASTCDVVFMNQQQYVFGKLDIAAVVDKVKQESYNTSDSSSLTRYRALQPEYKYAECPCLAGLNVAAMACMSRQGVG